jgi:ketosteroid isomerase-like protein
MRNSASPAKGGLMSIAWYWFLLLVFVAGNTQILLPQDIQQGRIVALENAWNQAIRQKDVKALAPLLAGELIYIGSDGTEMNKAQYLAMLATSVVHFEHITSESMRVQSYGQSAVVVGVYVEQGVNKGKPYSRRDRFVDTWINRNGVWMCVASQSTSILH